MAVVSPRRVVAALHHAHELPGEAFGANRSLQLPGFSVARRQHDRGGAPRGGAAAHARIRWQHDQIEAIVSGWPQALAAPRATALGFTADANIDEAVQAFIEDDLATQKTLGLSTSHPICSHALGMAIFAASSR